MKSRIISLLVSSALLLLLLCPSGVLSWDESSGILNVHVVPHSHNDPGWWKTFEGYYQDWTKGILSSVVRVLSENKDRTFIWAEISYFQRWWQDTTPEVQETVRRLVKNKQLEFVTAGWVMNDEANVHMVDMINQLTEGHEWLYKTLDVKPTIGWAIDPFGHSPTMAFVLQQMGFKAMVINRAHKEIKADFRDRQHLEFMWTGDQINSSASFNILTHMLPWKLYDIPNTCGPSWDICASFDFERDGVAVPITEANVKERSEILVNMYKEKAKMFRHNSVLIPLGDDFKYKTYDMTMRMFSQYEMMFKYINSNKKLGVNIKFSTLSDYFAELPEEGFPSYQGDFFTYCDEAEDYWSGYFTTRPFMKGLTRSTQATLRTGEILATLAHSHVGESVTEEEWNKWFDSIEHARRNVGLFQHHDGVTGTARRAVVEDYAHRLLSSLQSVAEHASDMALVVLSKSTTEKAKSLPEKLSWTTEPAKSQTQGIPHILNVQKDVAVVVVFNPLAHSRAEIVSVLVNTHDVRVTNSDGQEIAAQVDPVWNGGSRGQLSTQFMLHFVAKLPGLGLTTYFVQGGVRGRESVLSSVVDYSTSTTEDKSNEIAEGWHFDMKSLVPEKVLSIENSVYKVEVTGFGNIKTITRQQEGKQLLSVSVAQSFLAYSTYGRSGAYLFLPNGPAQPLQDEPTTVRVVTGPFVTTVHSVTTSAVKERIVRLFDCYPSYPAPNDVATPLPCHQANAVEILHEVDLTDGNKEIITRFATNISHANQFYTDSNGFDMRERVYNSHLPIQGNYYPITAATYIETHAPVSLKNTDKGHPSSPVRLTVLSHQAHGVSSLKEGELEIMLDRRLNQDDGRGLGEPVSDNVRTEIPLWLVVEPAIHDPFASPTLSTTASDVWNTRNYPPHSMHSSMTLTTTQPNEEWGTSHHLTIEPLSSSFPDHLRLLTLAPRDKSSGDIVMRIYHPPITTIPNINTDTDKVVETSRGKTVENVNFIASKDTIASADFSLDLFKHLSVVNAKETSLSLLYKVSDAVPQVSISIPPASIRSFVLNLRPGSTTPTVAPNLIDATEDVPVGDDLTPLGAVAPDLRNQGKGGNPMEGDLHEMLLADKKVETKETELGVGPSPDDEEGKSDGSLPTPLSLSQKDNMQKVSDDEEEFIVPVRDDGAGEKDNMEGQQEKAPEGDREGGKDTGNRLETSEQERKRLEEERTQKLRERAEEEKRRDKVREDKKREDLERQKNNDNNKEKSSGEGRVGKTGEGVVAATYTKPASTSGLYTMSVIFYIGLFAVLAGGGWLCRRSKRAGWAMGATGSTPSKIASSIWKEREDSMMKLL